MEMVSVVLNVILPVVPVNCDVVNPFMPMFPACAGLQVEDVVRNVTLPTAVPVTVPSAATVGRKTSEPVAELVIVQDPDPKTPSMVPESEADRVRVTGPDDGGVVVGGAEFDEGGVDPPPLATAAATAALAPPTMPMTAPLPSPFFFAVVVAPPAVVGGGPPRDGAAMLGAGVPICPVGVTRTRKTSRSICKSSMSFALSHTIVFSLPGETLGPTSPVSALARTENDCPPSFDTSSETANTVPAAPFKP